jgi:hypothetical protein
MSLELELVSAYVRVIEHLAGKHSQKSHGSGGSATDTESSESSEAKKLYKPSPDAKMQIEITKKIGQAVSRKNAISTWKKAPGNFDNAAHAALEYARKNNRNMVVVPGNSYMNKVYHIVPETEQVSKFTVSKKNNTVAVVTTSGDVLQGIAEDK